MHRTAATACLALALGAGAVACGEKDPTPAQIRDDARQQLVKGGATAAQAKCITDRIGDALLKTLSAGHEIDRSAKGFQAYSDALVACSATK